MTVIECARGGARQVCDEIKQFIEGLTMRNPCLVIPVVVGVKCRILVIGTA